jgi:hypothetical protein
MRLILAIGAVLLTSSCRQADSIELRALKPPGLPIFAGNWSSGGRLLRMEKPRCPADLRCRGVQTIRLKCTILEDGSVSKITFQDGPVLLLPSALAAVARWHYEPLRIYDPLTGKSTPHSFITEVHLRFEQ